MITDHLHFGPTRFWTTFALAVSLWSTTASGQDHDDHRHAPPDPDAPTSRDTAGAESGRADTGLFFFEIRDEDTGLTMPGRLTFRGEAADGLPLFPNHDAHPNNLAVRDSVVYALSGTSTITLPAGAYEVHASRGIEWSTQSVRFVMRPGRSVAWAADLKHEVDTTNWVSGDFHLHTLTYSGHGDSNMPERIISLVGEGVEFAVATDHNHHTDYDPTIAVLGATDRLTAVVGNEVSVPIGHFNAFPLAPNRVVGSHFDDANELFKVLRAEPNVFDIVPVIQVNHPRWDGIDYFNIAGLDAVTGAPQRGTWSDDFDTLEIMNENAGWGYHEPVVSGQPTASETHSVLRDWFNLLNLGKRHFAVGNSDSHTVGYAFAGYPRNYVASESDDPAAIDVPAYAAAIKAGRMFTTTGPFLQLTVNGAGMGETVSARHGAATVHILVRAASWIDTDRVRLIVNGTDAAVHDITEGPVRRVGRLNVSHKLELDHDAWIVALVEGDDSMAPIVDGGERPVRPIAISNPIWIDADGDGEWTSPAAYAEEIVAAAETASQAELAIAGLWRAEQGLALHAAARTQRPFAAALVRSVLGSRGTYRIERLHALRAAEALADSSLAEAARDAFDPGSDDPYMQVAALRAYAACAPDQAGASMVAFLESPARSAAPSALLEELLGRMPGVAVREWMVLGYFDAPEPGTVTNGCIGPEIDGDTTRAWTGRDGAELRWQPRTANESGYLNLRGLAADPALEENAAAAAQCWLYTDTARDVAVTLGTDDGCRVYVNGALMYENPARKGADPLEHIGRWSLEEGWNRVLFTVENGTGGFGASLRVLDGAVRTEAEGGERSGGQ